MSSLTGQISFLLMSETGRSRLVQGWHYREDDNVRQIEGKNDTWIHLHEHFMDFSTFRHPGPTISLNSFHFLLLSPLQKRPALHIWKTMTGPLLRAFC